MEPCNLERSGKIFLMKVRNLKYIIVCLVCFACNSEDASDCFQTSGKIVERDITIEPFEKILVNRDISLIILQGNEYNLRIETGENLLNDVEVIVVDNQLQLKDHNSCNYVRDYGLTKIYVTTPDLREIRSSTQYDVSSSGVLAFDNLTLISEDFSEKEAFSVGDFRLQVNTNKLRIITNNISSQYISGQTHELNIGYFAGAGRFEGTNLIAQHVQISHRGSNDMIVNPQLSLKGQLRGVGNLIAVNRPNVVEVEQLYTGELIIN